MFLLIKNFEFLKYSFPSISQIIPKYIQTQKGGLWNNWDAFLPLGSKGLRRRKCLEKMLE